MKMFNKKIFSLIILLSTSKTLHSIDCDPSFYMTFNSGVSWSMKPNFCVDLCPEDDTGNPGCFDIAEQGYNSSLGNAFLYGFEAGLDLNDWISMGTEFTYRGQYNYCQYQTVAGQQVDRVRRFDFENFSFMYNVYLNRTQNPCWSYDICNWTLAPYIGGGVGTSRNSLYNFHTVYDKAIKGDFEDVTVVMSPNVKSSFAAQVMVGAEADYNEKISLALGYRFFYGGKILTNNYAFNGDDDSYYSTYNPWEGKFKANEIVFSLHVTF
jgi:opacity protein-like surface antigen